MKFLRYCSRLVLRTRARDTTGTTEDRWPTSPNRSRELVRGRTRTRLHACPSHRSGVVSPSPTASDGTVRVRVVVEYDDGRGMDASRLRRLSRIISPVTTTVGSSTFLPTEVAPLVTVTFPPCSSKPPGCISSGLAPKSFSEIMISKSRSSIWMSGLASKMSWA